MTDGQFLKELEINAYCNQIKGYLVGHPARVDFKPTVPIVGTRDKVNRERTLDLACYTFTDDEKLILMQV